MTQLEYVGNLRIKRPYNPTIMIVILWLKPIIIVRLYLTIGYKARIVSKLSTSCFIAPYCYLIFNKNFLSSSKQNPLYVLHFIFDPANDVVKLFSTTQLRGFLKF